MVKMSPRAAARSALRRDRVAKLIDRWDRTKEADALSDAVAYTVGQIQSELIKLWRGRTGDAPATHIDFIHALLDTADRVSTYRPAARIAAVPDEEGRRSA